MEDTTVRYASVEFRKIDVKIMILQQVISQNFMQKVI